ncbi:MAG: hypothetical protein VW162_05365 [Alphaproteobacteria bacterium]
MELVVIFVSLFLINESDEVKRFSEHSNKLTVYKLVSEPCEGGLHDSGYSITVNNRVYFKQVNEDGTFGSVCKDND